MIYSTHSVPLSLKCRLVYSCMSGDTHTEADSAKKRHLRYFDFYLSLAQRGATIYCPQGRTRTSYISV